MDLPSDTAVHSHNSEVPKPKKTKSRNGCLTCKKKRLKCGEERPFCLNCQKKNVVCGGYATAFRWKSFEETAGQKMSKAASANTILGMNMNMSSSTNTNMLPNTGSMYTHQPVDIRRSSSDQPINLNSNHHHIHAHNHNHGHNHDHLQSQDKNQNDNSHPLPDHQVTSHQSSSYSNKALQKALEVATVSLTGKSSQEIALANALIATGKNPEFTQLNTSRKDSLNNGDDISPNNVEKKPAKPKKAKKPTQKKVKDVTQTPLESQSDNSSPINIKGELGAEDFEDEMPNGNMLLTSLAEAASKVPPSPPSGINSPFDMPSPNDFMFQNFRQSEFPQNVSVPSPLSLFKNMDDKVASPANHQYQSFTPGNPLYEVISSNTVNGSIDSPKLMAAINENPAALEQYQSMISNAAFSSMKSPQALNHASSSNANESQKNLNNLMSPGFSALITAFTNFEGDPLTAPSPANFELLPYTPHSQTNNANGNTPRNNQSSQQKQTPISAVSSPNPNVADRLSLYKKNFNNFNNSVIPHSVMSNENNSDYGSRSRSNSMENSGNNNLQRLTDDSPISTISVQSSHRSSSSNSNYHYINYQNLSFSIPKSVELNDQRLKMLSAFDRYTCGIMSMKNGPTENPWRTLLLPLSQEYQVMFNAISAMTCFHVARGDSELRLQGMKHMKSAIVELVHGLKDKKIPADVALATCLALAISESWDRHISTGIAHLKGARSMILQILNNLQLQTSDNDNSDTNSLIGGDHHFGSHRMGNKPRSSSMNSTTSSIMTINSNVGNSISKDLQFLFNAWVYFDVLARMTSDESSEDDEEQKIEEVVTKSNESDSDSDNITDGFTSGQKRKRSKSSSSRGDSPTYSKKRSNVNRQLEDSTALMEKFRSFNLDGGDYVDPLLGVGQTLFPIVSKVATLISKIRKENKPKNSLTTISQAVNLKNELERWQPSINHQNRLESEDPLFDLTSAISTAETYRYATMLYLHQAVPEIPSLSSHSLAEKILMLLAAIPASSRTCIAHIFPLLIASCEASPGEEREWVKDRWELLSRKMWIGNIDRALEVVKEVWARKDIMQKRRSNSKSGSNGMDSPNSDDGEGIIKLAARISGVANGGDGGDSIDEDDRIKSWTHWTTVMKCWGWEVLLA